MFSYILSLQIQRKDSYRKALRKKELNTGAMPLYSILTVLLRRVEGLAFWFWLKIFLGTLKFFLCCIKSIFLVNRKTIIINCMNISNWDDYKFQCLRKITRFQMLSVRCLVLFI